MNRIDINDMTVYFAKLRDDATIPSKIDENAGYDVYACFDYDYIIIPPHHTEMIPTGIASAFSSDYVFVFKERGSTGVKGIGQRAGVVDSGFRGMWVVPLSNHSDVPLVISKLSEEETKTILEEKYIWCNWCDRFTYYPYSKAICQALLLPVPKIGIIEIPYDNLKEIKSNRGVGKLGSSGK